MMVSSLTWVSNSCCSDVWLDQNDRRVDVGSPVVFFVHHLPFIPSSFNFSLSFGKGVVMVKEMVFEGELSIRSWLRVRFIVNVYVSLCCRLPVPFFSRKCFRYVIHLNYVGCGPLILKTFTKKARQFAEGCFLQEPHKRV